EIHFNHAKIPEEAFEQWNRRLTRMNWDNLFVMMQTTNKDREHEFNQIADSVGFKKCICFVPHETSEPHSMRIHIRPSDRFFFDAVNATGINRGGSYPFNAIKLLMGDPDYVRYVPDDPEEAEDMPCRG
ncbi:MAG: DUF1919 domain-containing protein, partial [Atopobiaceae bacterium]|nr:DUF1919 domain-containing protein [Atopobiaceae bacterium]